MQPFIECQHLAAEKSSFRTSRNNAIIMLKSQFPPANSYSFPQIFFSKERYCIFIAQVGTAVLKGQNSSQNSYQV